MTGPLISTENMKEALIKCGGMMTYAADMLGCSHSTISLRAKGDPDLQEVIRQARERHVDDAEISLRNLVKSKDLGAVCFTLKTVGKDRGYTEHLLAATEKALTDATAALQKVNAYLYQSAPEPEEGKELSVDRTD